MENEDEYTRFVNWLISNGSILNSTIFPFKFRNITGVAANTDIGPNEAMFYIPKKVIIDSNYIKEHHLKSFYERNKILVKRKYDTNNLINLTLFLIFESFKKEDSLAPCYPRFHSGKMVFVIARPQSLRNDGQLCRNVFDLVLPTSRDADSHVSVASHL